MKSNFYIFFIIYLFSCQKNERFDLTPLLYVKEITFESDHYKNKKEFKSPQGTNQIFLKAKDICLSYYIPLEGEDGELSLSTGDNCEIKKSFIKNKTAFYYELKQDSLELFLNGKIFKSSFLNLSLNNKNKVLELAINEKAQEDSLEDGTLCYKVKDGCEVEENICNKCKNKIYTPVVGSNCRSSYNKICGDLSCGGLYENACIRGFNASKLKYHYCFNDSPVGYCRDGLRVVCKDFILKCEY